jgi:membrane dipeptidase
VVKDNLLDSPVGFVQVTLYDELFTKIDSTISSAGGDWEIQFDPTRVSENINSPGSFSLLQNYPNPFNPSTQIGFNLVKEGNIRLIVNNVLGQKIEEIEQYLPAGSYSIEWRGAGSAGVYFYTLVQDGKSFSKKMIQLDGDLAGGFSAVRATNYNNKPGLKKISSGKYNLVFSKFSYVNDTLTVDQTGGSYFETYLETIHSKSLVFDLHNDVLERMLGDDSYHLVDLHSRWHTDVPRLKLGGVDAQLFVAWVDPTQYSGKHFETTQKLVQMFQDEVFMNYNDLVQTYNTATTISAIDENKIAGVLVVEGGHSIENSIDNLKTLYNQGMRYLTITWNNSTDWAVSSADSRSTTVGLSDFGREVIRTMDTLGVIIDVSHTGIKTIEDILEVTKNPIIASHSGVRALHNHSRNLYDDQIEAIANSGGVVGVVFYPPFLGSPSSSVNIATVIKHINYIVNLVGIDYIALGSDFDGIGNNTVNGLEDVTKFPFLTYELLEEGYTREEVEKIIGGNFMRVFKQVCGE